MKHPLNPQDLSTLQRTYLFAVLSEELFAEAVRHSYALRLDAGQPVFREGDLAEAFYWVQEGLIRLSRVSPQGEEKVIDLIGPKHFFAEAALFMGKRFPVDASAQTQTRLIVIDGANFKTWLAQDAERCFRLIGGISARLHSLVNEIDRLTLMKGADRLMQYLLDHSEPDESGRTVVDLIAPKQVIASRIGIKPETLSRLLHKLVDLGYIEQHGQQVWITRQGLEIPLEDPI